MGEEKTYLKSRRDIAEAINFGWYQVVKINRETPAPGWDDNFVGDKVLVAPEGEIDRSKFIRCQIHKFGDEPERYSLMPETIVLQDGFGYSDVIEMTEWAQAPVIRAGEIVVVIEDYPKAKTCAVHLMRVSKLNGKFVFPTCYLEELEG